MSITSKRGRPKKKPNYDKQASIQEQLNQAVSLFSEPYDDRDDRPADAPSVHYVAEQMRTTTIRARKLLITAEYYSTVMSRKVLELQKRGLSVQEIQEKTGLSAASVYSYLPYSKTIYNLDEASVTADRHRLFRKRNKACEKLLENVDSSEAEKYLWEAILVFENYPFKTAKGLPLKYKVKGGEMFFNRKEKSITRATVELAFHKARKVQMAEGCVSGPKKIGTFGASYLHPVFLRFGICKQLADEESFFKED